MNTLDIWVNFVSDLRIDSVSAQGAADYAKVLTDSLLMIGGFNSAASTSTSSNVKNSPLPMHSLDTDIKN